MNKLTLNESAKGDHIVFRCGKGGCSKNKNLNALSKEIAMWQNKLVILFPLQVTLFCDCNVAWMKKTVHIISQPVTPCAWPPDLVGVDWDCELMADSLRCYETRRFHPVSLAMHF